MSSQETGEASGRTGGRVPKWLAIVAVVVLVAGLATLGVFGTRYLEARSAHQLAQERNEVEQAAKTVIEYAFSFDHRDVDDSLVRLAEISTGEFRTEQEQWADDVRKRVVEQKAVTDATVSNVAVEVLEPDAGNAAVLVVFTAHSEREGEEPITGRQAMRVDLTLEDGVWKADAVNQVGVTVPVGESSASVQGLEVPGGSGSEGSEGTAEGEGAPEKDDDDTTAPADESGEQTDSGDTTSPTTSTGR